MTTTFTASLRLAKPGLGDSGWGPVVTGGATDLTDSAIAGYTTVSMPSNADYTLTVSNGAADEARSMMLNITSAVSLTTTRNIICPTVSKLYIVKNSTTGSQSITVKTAAGVGVTIANGSTAIVMCNGTDVITAATGSDITFSQTGTGAQTRSVQNKLRESVSPADYGAVGNGVADDTTALQNFFNAVTTGGRIGFIPSGTYLITAPVNITLGSSGFSIMGGGGAIIAVSNSFAGGTSALNIVGAGSAVDWTLGGFTLTGTLGSTGTATEGITVGSTSVAVNIFGYRFSRIQQIQVTGFATNWKIVHARMIEFLGCSAWNTSVIATNQTNLLITQAGAFTGDLRFTNCQYVTKTVSGNKNVSITSPTGPYSNITGFGNVAGIKFIGCDFYAGDKSIYLYATSAAYISDIWFTGGCQLDQETTNGIWLESNNTSTNIEDIHIEGAYIDKSTSSQVTLTSTGTLGTIKSVWLSQCSMWRGQSFAVNLVGSALSGIHVLNNEIVDCAGTVAIEVNGATATRVRGNRHRTGLLSQQPNYLIQVESGTTDFELTGNSGTVATAVINDLSGSITSKTINLNPGYNPRPQASITVTASPFTYTNYSGASQLISVGGGTISAITVDGLAITPTTNLFVPVPSGKALVVTYSSAPTMFSLGY